MIFQTRYLLFDGACGFCQRTARMVRWLNWLGKVVPKDFVREWPTLKQAFPNLEMEHCLKDMHVIRDDGRIDRGFDGYRSLAWTLPILWILLPLLYLPPIYWIGTKVYRHIADHRRRACVIPPNQTAERDKQSLLIGIIAASR